jgi:type I restriction enzyme S subunit
MGGNKDFKDLPEGWKWVRLGEVVIENPKSPFKVEDCDNFGNFPFFTSGDNVLRHSHFLVDEENLFIATGGKAKINYFYGKASYSADTYSLKVKDLNTKYIFYTLLKDIEIIDYKFFSGSGLKHLQKDDFKGLLIPLPPLPEQQKISEILETVDNAIEKTEKIIEKYKRIKQGLMQDLLTKGIDENGNIRNEKTHKFKDSPLGRMPEEWEVVRLGEISKTITKGTTPTTYGFSYVNDGINFIKIESIDENGNFIIEKFEHIDKKTNDYLSRSKLEEGDILFSIAGALGRVVIIEKSVLPANTNQALAIIRLKEKKETTIKFLKFYLTSFLIQNYIENILVKSAQSNLTLKDINNFLIPFPPLPEQQRIAEILSQIDKTIEKEEQYKEKLKRLKQGLMEDLLTGKVRVNHLVEEEEK